MTRMVKPSRLVELVNSVWRAFDQLVAATGGAALKIEVLGPIYLVASGLLRPDAEHATSLAALALACKRAAKTFDLELRMGLHSGSVVGGAR